MAAKPPEMNACGNRAMQVRRIWTASVVIGIEPKSAQIGGSGASAPRLPVTFCDETWPLPGSTRDRRLLVSWMLLRVPDGCGADHRLILALRPERSVSRDDPVRIGSGIRGARAAGRTWPR
jgi:hypothetical protein